jgi:chromosome segregation ATPase
VVFILSFSPDTVPFLFLSCLICITQRKVWLNELARLDDETEMIRQELTNTEKEVEAEANELEAVAKECQLLEVQVLKENKLQSAAREEAEELKRKANKLKDDLAMAEWKMQELEAEEQGLQSKIVSSPGRRKNELKTAREELDKMKLQVSELDDATQKGKTSCRNLVQALKDVSTAVGNLNRLQEKCNRKVEIDNKLEKALGDIATKQNERKTLLEETQEAEREVVRSEERIEAQRKQHQIQIDALQEALESAKSQLLKVEKDRRDGMIRINAWEKDVQRLEQEIQQQRLETTDEIDRMVTEYKVLEEDFLRLDQKRMGTLQSNTAIIDT